MTNDVYLSQGYVTPEDIILDNLIAPVSYTLRHTEDWGCKILRATGGSMRRGLSAITRRPFKVADTPDDWDQLNANWEVTSSHYHSLDCSLHAKAGDPPYTTLKNSVVPYVDLTNGRFVTWLMFTGNEQSNHLVFRSWGSGNNYQLMLYGAGGPYVCAIRRELYGKHYEFVEFSSPFALETWYKVRVTWHGLEGESLYIIAEYLKAGVWTDLCAMAEDPTNWWLDVGGGVGFLFYDPETYIDDTEVWEELE